jgi:DNA polymerase I-like protein with 3'-5' exonuclease and polymerase domains
MTIIETHKLKSTDLTPGDTLQTYCGLDCCVTFEVFEELWRLLDATPPITYSFKLAMQAPALDMMLRGFAIDPMARDTALDGLRRERDGLQSMLDEFATAFWGKSLNARSYPQLKDFFYGAMRIPEITLSFKGTRRVSVNREALEKIEVYYHARLFVSVILAIRDVAKRIEVLETEVDSDGRMRTSYNIAGTESERWSSSSNAFGTGTNLQNITPELRRVFVADPGWKLCGIDLEQAESREVGWLFGTLFGDWTYLNACEDGDLHTSTAKLIWPNLVASRDDANKPFYRQFSYRDMAKRGGHLTNYMGTAWTASRSLKVPQAIMENFQAKYIATYSSFPRWWRHCAQALETEQSITTPFGNTRHFFGRPRDDATLREAIAHSPQSSTALRLNLALWRVWSIMGTRVQLLAQVHDALYFQYRETDDESSIIAQALALCSTPLAHNSRTFDVPGEAKTGWNWGAFGPDNPDGLKKYKGSDPRQRTRGLARVM